MELKNMNKKLAAGLVTASLILTMLTASACTADTVTTQTGDDGTVTTTVTTTQNTEITTISDTSTAAVTADYDEEAATVFTFTDDGITAEDGDYTGYKIDGTDLSIKEAGVYVLTGSCADGSVTVKKGTTDVTLVLAGLTLTNEGTETTATAPLAINKSTGVTIIVADGTVNTLTDSVYNNDDVYTANEEAENAVIKCKDGSQVVITGSGTLNIVSNGKNGIKSGTTDTSTDEANPRDAFLTIAGPTLNITTTVNDAINAEQELNVLSGTLTIDAADDAIHSDLLLNIGVANTAGPTIDILGSTEGIEGATVNIYSGDISILSTDDLINAANSDLKNYDFAINIYGGTIVAVSETGDGFDSNGNLNIYGGSIEVWCVSGADNQPLDADGTVNIAGGTVLAAGMSSGMGMNLTASQGYVIYGSSANGMGGFGGKGGFGGQTNTANATVQKSATVTITDESGKTVYTTAAPAAATYIVFSSADLTSGSTYTLKANGTSAGTATASTGTSMGNMFNGGQPGQMPNQNGENGQMPTPPSDGNFTPGENGQMPTPPTDGSFTPGENGQMPTPPTDGNFTPGQRPDFGGPNGNGQQPSPSDNSPQSI